MTRHVMPTRHRAATSAAPSARAERAWLVVKGAISGAAARCQPPPHVATGTAVILFVLAVFWSLPQHCLSRLCRRALLVVRSALAAGAGELALDALVKPRDADDRALVGACADRFEFIAGLHTKGDGAAFCV